MNYNNKIIEIIALSALKGIGPAFVKKVVSNYTFECTNLIQEIQIPSLGTEESRS